MNINQKNRVVRLEQHETKTAQKQEYCGCHCHNKSILDFDILSDERINAIAEMIESFGSFKKPDGTWQTYADAILERNANLPKCTCKCSH